VELLNKRHEKLELRMIRIIREFKGDKSDSFRAHLLAFDYVCDMTESARAMVEAEHNYLANLHARPHGAFLLAYAEVIALFTAYSGRIVRALETGSSESNSDLLAAKRRIVADIQRMQTKLLMELRDITALMHRVHQLYVA